MRGDSKGSSSSRRTARFTSDDPILATFRNKVAFWEEEFITFWEEFMAFCEEEFMSIHVTAFAVVVSGADLDI